MMWRICTRVPTLVLAAALLCPACADTPETGDLYAEADRAIASGDLELAAQRLEKLLEIEPDHWAARCRLGEIHIAAGRISQARVELEAAVTLNPRSGPCMSRLSQALLLEGELAAAEPYLVEASRLLPEDVGIRHNLARLYEMTDRPDLALSENLRLLGLAPEGERTRLELRVARILRDLSRQEEAVGRYEAYLLGKPDDHEVRAELADLLMSLSRHEEALTEYDRVIEAGAAGAQVLASAGAICILMSNFDRAVDLLERSVILDPGAVAPQLGLATALAQRGEDERAVKVLEALIARDPDNPRAHSLLGQSLRKLGRMEEARVAFAKHDRIQNGLLAERDAQVH